MSDDIHGVFVQEARERLDEMEAGLLRLEQGDPDPEILHGCASSFQHFCWNPELVTEPFP